MKGDHLKGNSFRPPESFQSLTGKPHHDNSDSDSRMKNLGQLQSEVIGLRLQNEALRGRKAEMATVRALLADVIYSISEPIALAESDKAR